MTTGWLHRGYRWSLRACAQRGTPTSISECSFATLSHQNAACLWPPTAGLPGLPNSNLPAARPGGDPASSPAPRSRQGLLGKPCPARDLARTGSESAGKEVAWQGCLALASNCLRCFWKAEARLDRPSFQVVPKLSQVVPGVASSTRLSVSHLTDRLFEPVCPLSSFRHPARRCPLRMVLDLDVDKTLLIDHRLHRFKLAAADNPALPHAMQRRCRPRHLSGSSFLSAEERKSTRSAAFLQLQPHPTT